MSAVALYRSLLVLVAILGLAAIFAGSAVLAQDASDGLEGPDKQDTLEIGDTILDGPTGRAGHAAPSDVSVKSSTNTSVTIHWTPLPSTLVNRYRVEYRKSGASSWTVAGYQSAPSTRDKMTATVSSLTCNPRATYEFRVAGRDALNSQYETSSSVSWILNCEPNTTTVTITGRGAGSASSRSAAESQARAAAIADFNSKVADHEGDVVPPIPTPSLSSSATSSQSVSSGTTSRSAQGQGSSEDIQAAIDAARSNSVSAFNQAARAVLGFVSTSNVNTVLAAALEPQYETASRSTVTNGSGTGVTQDDAAADARFNAVHAFTLLANSGQLGIVHAIGSQSFGPVSYGTGPGDQITASVSVTTNWTERVSTTWTATATTNGTVHWQITTTTWNATATASAQVTFNLGDDPPPPPTCTNSDPAFPASETGIREIPENRSSGTLVGSPVAAEDSDTVGLTYSLSGTDASSFTISSAGQLRSAEEFDHEAKSSYSFTVSVRDGRDANCVADTATDDTIGVTVTVTNEPPTIDSGPSSPSYAEGGTDPVGSYTASDPGGGTISWSLPNTSFETDRSDFSISNGGVLSFDSPPNYESPPASNVYKITVRASDGSLADDRNVTVTVTNEPPMIDSGPSSPSYAEGGTDPVGTYTASDPGGGTISWSLPNTAFETDLDDFSISSSGVLSFNSPPDYESPHDSDRNNVYKVTVRASDGSLSASRNVTVTVTNRSPTINSGLASISYAEGRTDLAETYAATDPGGGAISWSLPNTSFETDRSDFSISNSGVLSFDSSPDYESPHDSDRNNVYKVTVRASDGSLSDDRNVTITVTNRSPTIDSGLASISYAEGRTDLAETYAASDPGGGTISWSLPNTSFETDRSDFTISGGVLSFRATPNYEDPHDSNLDNVYKITVRASDGRLSADRNVTVTVTNRAPTIPSGPSSPSYAEGGTGSVGTYRATDPAGGTITWSLPNTTFETDLSDFSISSSGVLSFDTSPDYENPHDSDRNNVYKVTVRASDGSLADDRNVLISVSDVAECPAVPDRPGVSPPNATVTDELRVTWDEPSNTGPPITGYAVLYKAVDDAAYKIATASTPNRAWTLTGLEPNTEYKARVRAMNDECDSGLYSEPGAGMTNALLVPTVTITPDVDAMGNTITSVREGSSIRFTLTASRAPTSNILVRVSITEVGDFLDHSLGVSTLVPINSGSRTGVLTLYTTWDRTDEMHGSVEVELLSGNGYTISRLSRERTASVDITDIDKPARPTGLDYNGNIVDGKVKLWWDGPAEADAYDLRYGFEECSENTMTKAVDCPALPVASGR